MRSLTIARTWDGLEIPVSERVQILAGVSADALVLHVDAPYFGDPPPPGSAGPCEGLWAYEVVELFIEGPSGRYTEIELSPHGHHLVLRLSRPRQVIDRCLPIAFQSVRTRERWRGTARVPLGLLPEDRPLRGNAYAMHGEGSARRYLAMFPVPGAKPDFHQPHRFELLGLPHLEEA